MDPLTHTLAGANLAATRLGATTRFAAAALVIGANLPDVDSILYFTGHQDLAFGFRRGWTHGVLARLVLPCLQTALLLLADRLRPSAARPANARMLLLLSALAICTHPFLDWLNTYGMRWLMPFRGTWFYGDSVYIMDPWLWLILGAGWLAGKRPNVWLIGAWLFFVVAISWIVSRRSPQYLVVIAIVAIVLLAALVWRTEKHLATAALMLATLYIGGRLTIHAVTARAVQREIPDARRLMVGPHPIDPRRWTVIAETANEYRFGDYVWGTGLTLHPETAPVPVDSPEYRQARAHPDLRGFMTWARFPAYRIERANGKTHVTLYDARRMGGSARTVTLD
ncbi:MAG TPA: metal-dependent hydrolase [Thermoanaerobaculia bacterium]|nr:metal-dependent hydrolase [Thermoanaerobaculia bacterium]